MAKETETKESQAKETKSKETKAKATKPKEPKSDETKSKATRSKETKATATKNIRIQWYRSAIATPEKHKVIVRSLGLTKLNQVVERPDTPSIRGMVAKVPHLLRIVE